MLLLGTNYTKLIIAFDYISQPRNCTHRVHFIASQMSLVYFAAIGRTKDFLPVPMSNLTSIFDYDFIVFSMDYYWSATIYCVPI